MAASYARPFAMGRLLAGQFDGRDEWRRSASDSPGRSGPQHKRRQEASSSTL
jgi:hypothetical protein